MPVLRLFVLSCLMCIAFAASPSRFDPDWKTYSDPDEPDKSQNRFVAVHKVTGDVYMASLDNIYHFDSDLVLKKKVEFGTLMACETPETSCANKTLRPNLPTAMVLVYHLEPWYLMLCGTLYNNLCQLRPLNDLDRVFWIGPYNDPVARSILYRGDPAFFGLGYGNQTVFFSGTDWHPDRDSGLPFFSSKVLESRNLQFRFRYAYKSDSALSAIFFKHPYMQVLLYTFSHGSYVYILYIRARGTASETVLAQICAGDGTFTSYVEVKLACRDDQTYYSLSTVAYFGPGYEGGRPVQHLYLVFVNRSTGICSFSIRQLDEQFDAAVEDCFGNGNTTYTMDLKTADSLKCQSKDSKEFCGSSANPYIMSNQTIISEPTYTVHLREFRITALVVHEENGRIVGFLGTKVSFFIKALLDVPKGTNRNTMLHLQFTDADEIEPSIAFDLKEEHIYFLNRNKIVKYPIRSCSIYKTCSECFDDDARRHPLDCGWCNGRCEKRQKCPAELFSRSNCTPSVESVNPLIGSTHGGTHLSIVGKNFGTQKSSTLNSVTINNVPCTILLWEMERIMCVTGPSPDDAVTPVVVTVRDDSNKTLGFMYAGSSKNNESFSYVTPKLRDIVPDRGSTAGGTNLTIFGEHLDIGKVYSMNIRRRICTDLKIHALFATCITGASEDAKLKDVIELRMDSIYVVPEHGLSDPSQLFQYMKDPEILEIRPTATVLSFRGNITVSGLNLNNAKYPSLLVSVLPPEGQLLELSQDCWHDPGANGEAMMCSIPNLDSIDVALPQDGRPLIAEVNFSMSPFKSNFPMLKHPYLSFYPEPEFQNEQAIVHNRTILEIKGKYPGSGSLAYLTNVQIGESDRCNISKLTSDALYCEFDPELLHNASIWGKNLSVKVSTGSTHQHAGYLVLSELDEAEPLVQAESWPLVAGSVLCLLLLLAVAALCCIRWHRRRKCPNVFVRVPSVIFNNDFRRNQSCASADNTVAEDTVHQPLIRTFSRQPSSTTTTSSPPAQLDIPETITEVTPETRQPTTRYSRQQSSSTTTNETASNPSIDDTVTRPPLLMPLSRQQPASQISRPASRIPATDMTDAFSHPGYLGMDRKSNGTTVHPVMNEPSIAEDTVAKIPLSRQQPANQISRPASRIPATDMTDAFSHPGYLGMDRQSNGTTVHPMVPVPLQPITTSTSRKRQLDNQDNYQSLDETLRILAQDGYMISSEDLIITDDQIGSGQFGSVFKGEYRSPRNPRLEVAVKTIRDSPDVTDLTVKEFIDEAFQMKNFRHENILQLIGICFAGSQPVMVLPFLHKGDLCSYLRDENNKIYKMDLFKFSTQVAAGMAYLAQQKYVHRDLAARNCLISIDMNVKVSDFGLSRDVYESDYYRVDNKMRKLPFRWMAPECIEKDIFTVKSDVWSYGILLWEIMTVGLMPYEAIHNWDILDFLKAGRRLKCPQYCSRDLYKVMENCWEYDAAKRPSFEELHTTVKDKWQTASYKDKVQTVRPQNRIFCNLE